MSSVVTMLKNKILKASWLSWQSCHYDNKNKSVYLFHTSLLMIFEAYYDMLLQHPLKFNNENVLFFTFTEKLEVPIGEIQNSKT